MYFKRIYMHGFKSFAEPVTIELGEGITCIVGPNGSGKSNISDALRWVLGEQSPKALRGGRMDEVIFAGTENRKSRGMAEVTLVIDNSTGILPIDFNEVAITRRMYRSGESEYLINNNHCRLRDIRELIMDTGIGVDGYSIIGQGKIADIVSNKPESRREIFEEAAGIVMYRTKKSEVERKLSASNANLERVNDIVSEIEGRIDSLRDDSEKAKAYLELRDKYKEVEINITLKNIENLDLKTEYLKDDISEIEAEIEELRELKGNSDAASEKDRLRAEELEGLAKKASDDLITTINEINTLVKKSEIERTRLDAAEDTVKRLENDGAALKEELEKEQLSYEGLLRDKENIDGELKKLGIILGEKISEYEKITERLGKEAAGIDDRKNEIYELSSQARSRRAEAASLENLAKTLISRKELLLSEKKESMLRRQEAEEAAEKERNERERLERSVEDKKGSVKKLSLTYNDSLEEERRILKELDSLRMTLGQLTGRKRVLEEMESSYEGYNNAVKYIMRSGTGGLDGVVADLIKVPHGYETAVETALGSSIQNIVCRTDNDAKKAVELLKKNRAGRLTFLPVSSVKGRKADPGRMSGAEGFIGIASDCVSFEERYRSIFDYLLGRTVIVRDMDHAVMLSKSSNSSLRFVTLEGEVINSGGAITGGRYRHNTANILGRKADIERLSEEIAVKETEKSRYEDEASSLKKKCEELSIAISSENEDSKKLEMELVMCRNRCEASENLVRDIDIKNEKDESELSRIAEEENSSLAMTETLLREADEAEKNIEKMTEETGNALSVYEAGKEELSALNEEIIKARMASGTCSEQKNSIDSMAERISSRIEEIMSDIRDKEKEKTELIARREEMLSGRGSDRQNILEMTGKKENLENYIKDISDERARLSEEMAKNDREKNSAGEKLEALAGSKYELEIKLAREETQLGHLKDRLWDEFEISYIQAAEFKKKDFIMNTAAKEARELRAKIKSLGDVNVGSIKEYEQVSERYAFLTEQRDDILKASRSLEDMVSDMDRTIKQKFKESFDGIVVNFEDIFRKLFGGGHAELRLEDESDPLGSGIEIIAQPPGKKLRNINLMSGGEKTMTAIALMFAVLKTKPTPFCILDEVEAALDEVNIDRFADYLKEFKGIQFALVTHQKATMEHADVLYGVTMPEQGVSKLISLKLGDTIDMDL